MSPPADLRYLQTHEWHRLEGDSVTVGITQIAADELTDVTYVSLPKVGTALSANGRFGEIESVKATSDLYCGMGGTVTAVNAELSDNPGLVNSDPYGKGWMIKLRISDRAQWDKLLPADEYQKKTGH